MGLREQLDADLKAAMLAKQQDKVQALRNIKAVVRNKEIDGKTTLDDAGMITVLASLKKQREDAIEQFKQGGRQDLVDKESAELAVIQGYLPQALSNDELIAVIKKAITETQAAGPKDMGKVMKIVSAETKGRADGKLVSEKVKEELGKLG